MKIEFHLAWLKAGGSIPKAFKSTAARELFLEYVTRISKFVPCEAAGIGADGYERKSGTKIWVCQRGAGAKTPSSEEVAIGLRQLADLGVRALDIWVGGADGFSERELGRLQPDLLWSFGPLTLPHELAAVIVGEQIYRAWTIIRNQPYHLAH